MGIGTTNPISKLTVGGDASISGLVSIGNTIRSSGNLNLQSDNKIWGFSTDGAITLGGNSTISDTIQHGNLQMAGLYLTGGIEVPVSLNSDTFSQLYWMPDVTDTVNFDPYYGGPIYNWAAVDNAGFTVATKPDPTNPRNSWVFDLNGKLTLPKGSILSETSTTTIISPPTAQPGQSLVIRPTSALWSVTSSGYIVYGQPITISVNLLNWAYYGTVNYEITGTGVNSTTLGRATTGKVVFTGISEPDTQTITWTIPANSNISEFTFTLTTVDGTYQSGPPGPDPALYYNFEFNALPTGYYVIVTNNGISSSEANHIHLVAGDPITTDIYLGDDDQYIKIEKNGGNVVVGTSTNTNQWIFGTDGNTLFPGGIGASFYNGSGTNLTGIVTSIVAGVGITISSSTGQVTVSADTSTVYPSERFINLTGIHTLANQSAAQSLFDGGGGPAGGLISFGTGTYLFECNFYITSISSGNNGFGFALGGTATKTEGWQAIAEKGNTLNSPASSSQKMTWNTSPNVQLTQATGNQCTAQIKGTFRITVAGTIIPQVSLESAAAGIVQPNSYFRVTRIGSATTSYN